MKRKTDYVLFFSVVFSNTFLSQSLEATPLPALETEMSAAELTAGVLLKVPCLDEDDFL